MLEYKKGWFTERARVYQELSERDKLFNKIDSTFFYFTSPDAGWIKMEMYLNGKKQLTCSCSNVSDPFPDMKNWLEDIVRSNNMETTMHIDSEGEEVYLHYEKIRDAESGFSMKKHYFDANTNPEIGLFFVYSSSTDSIPFYALCETKDFINSIYLALLSLCSNCYNTHYSDFTEDWHFGENSKKRGRKLGKMTFYNLIKSPLIEWNIRSPFRYNDSIRFRKTPLIKETISMWCDYGDALFWSGGIAGKRGCCGNAKSFFTETSGEIRLDSIKGLREWYNEWTLDPLAKWGKKQMRTWQERGYTLALKVRELLPDTIDLYYNDWWPKKKVIRIEYEESYPMIVFNERCLSKSSNI